MSKLSMVILIALVAVFTFIGGGLYLVNAQLNKDNVKITDYQIFEIAKGTSTRTIAANLEGRGIIKSKLIFLIGVKLSKQSLNYGYYQIEPKASIAGVIATLGGNGTKVEKITIPEGFRTEQIAQVLVSKGILKYDDFMTAAKGKEGKLFPENYFFSPKMPVGKIVSTMTDNYDSKVKTLKMTDETLIIASIVEREAINDTERALIAGVYKNRLAINMQLEADPTVQYGRDVNNLAILPTADKLTYKFWKPVTLSDYNSIKSDYNTYLIAALPPTPICNPGIKSIEATINYQKHKYLFFLQNDGQIFPSETISQHDQYRAKVLGAKI